MNPIDKYIHGFHFKPLTGLHNRIIQVIDSFDSFEEDGGPGSGNWGHKGRPGKKGGSGKGGGKHYRTQNAETGKYEARVLTPEEMAQRERQNSSGPVGFRKGKGESFIPKANPSTPAVDPETDPEHAPVDQVIQTVLKKSKAYDDAHIAAKNAYMAIIDAQREKTRLKNWIASYRDVAYLSDKDIKQLKQKSDAAEDTYKQLTDLNDRIEQMSNNKPQRGTEEYHQWKSQLDLLNMQRTAKQELYYKLYDATNALNRREEYDGFKERLDAIDIPALQQKKIDLEKKESQAMDSYLDYLKEAKKNPQYSQDIYDLPDKDPNGIDPIIQGNNRRERLQSRHKVADEIRKKREENGGKYRDPDSGLAKGLKPENYELVASAIDACPDKDAQAVFDAYGSLVGVSQTNVPDDKQCCNWNASIEVNEDDRSRVQKYGMPAGEVMMHESGHAIDMQAGRAYNRRRPPDKYTTFSTQYKNGLYLQTLQEEYNAHINQRAKKLKQQWTKNKSNPDWLFENGLIEQDQYNYWKQVGHPSSWLGYPKRFQPTMARNSIKMDLMKLPDKERSDVSDMFCMLSRGKLRAAWGHEQDYAREPKRAAHEAFAQMFSATVMSPDSLQKIKQFYPKSYAVFQDMMKQLGGRKDEVQ